MWDHIKHSGNDNLHSLNLEFLNVDVYRENEDHLWEVQVVEACGSINTVIKSHKAFVNLEEAKLEGIRIAKKLLGKALNKVQVSEVELKCELKAKSK